MAWKVRVAINSSAARFKCGIAGDKTDDFSQPWLLRHFDQIQFYPVDADELLRLREEFPAGKFKLDIREETFSLREYRKFLADISEEAASFKIHQQSSL